MPWNGSGTFSRVHDWTVDRDAGVKMLATRFDEDADDMATAINNCVARDGQNSPTGDLPMGSNKHTSVANASARNQYGAAGQVQDGSFLYAADSGSANAYVITLAPAVTAYAAGQTFRFRAANANTGASTINVNSVGAKSIVKDVSTALAAGDINAGEVITIAYDGTNFQMVPTIDATVSTLSLGNLATQNAGTGLANSGSNLNIDLNSLSEETTVDKANDEIFFYDNSAAAYRKIPPDTFRSQLKLARITTGTYTGDGATSKGITGLGFQPKYLKIWIRITADEGTLGYFETTDTIIDDHAQGGAILTNSSTVEFLNNRIISLDSDGFTVDDDGSDKSPNKDGMVYNFFALG